MLQPCWATEWKGGGAEAREGAVTQGGAAPCPHSPGSALPCVSRGRSGAPRPGGTARRARHRAEASRPPPLPIPGRRVPAATCPAARTLTPFQTRLCPLPDPLGPGTFYPFTLVSALQFSLMNVLSAPDPGTAKRFHNCFPWRRAPW